MNAVENDIRALVDKELAAANERFPQFHSAHEGYAVIQEEVDELKEDMDRINCRIASLLICGVICIALLIGMLWYYNNTASGQRALVDQESELSNGMERVIRVYTANGDLIAEFEGRIDIEGNDGGYVLFDYQGKRYTYYNCFVESIAEIGG